MSDESKQGELYKKLTVDDENDLMIGSDFFTSEPILNVDKITRILDAARSEMPRIIPVHRFEPDEHGDIVAPLEQNPNSSFINDYVVDGIEWKKWVDKWFGAP